MKLLFVTEARFIKDSNGNYYGESSYNYQLWEQYLTSFSHVFVMARVKFDPSFEGNLTHLSSHISVTFIELPYYVGSIEFIKVFLSLKRTISRGINDFTGPIICRIPGNIGDIAISHLVKIKRGYAVEVVGDPWDLFAPGVLNHPLRRFLRFLFYKRLRRNVASADAVLYVTKKKLQSRYPSRTDAFSIGVSDVIIGGSNIALSPKKYNLALSVRLISIGSLEQMYKSPDIVLRAVKLLQDRGINAELVWLGGGIYEGEMRKLAEILNIQENVRFLGNLGKEAVWNYLKESDIFILASKTEGLPRALVEAMAAGIPCVATNVGGIPELLESNVLIPINSSVALANKISELIANKDFYIEQSKKNIELARNYTLEKLQGERSKFFAYLHEQNKPK